MTHEEALNLIIANSCGKMNERDQELHGEHYRERYNIPAEEMDKRLTIVELDLHCCNAVIVAELISTDPTIDYRIISVKIV